MAMTPEQVENVLEAMASALRAYAKVWGVEAVRLTLIRSDGGRRTIDYTTEEEER